MPVTNLFAVREFVGLQPVMHMRRAPMHVGYGIMREAEQRRVRD